MWDAHCTMRLAKQAGAVSGRRRPLAAPVAKYAQCSYSFGRRNRLCYCCQCRVSSHTVFLCSTALPCLTRQRAAQEDKLGNGRGTAAHHDGLPERGSRNDARGKRRQKKEVANRTSLISHANRERSRALEKTTTSPHSAGSFRNTRYEVRRDNRSGGALGSMMKGGVRPEMSRIA